MQVKQYIYQSPSPNAVQMGRLDPSSQKSESTDFETKAESKSLKEVTQSSVVQSPQKIEPAISATKIDIYA